MFVECKTTKQTYYCEAVPKWTINSNDDVTMTLSHYEIYSDGMMILETLTEEELMLYYTIKKGH